jgi:hypothetical protein
MDSVRARFFWEGFGEKKKCHMVSWDTLCKPRDFGGLGFIDSRTRNICLLSKWIYRLENGCEDLSCQILRNKYLRADGFYQSREGGLNFGDLSIKLYFGCAWGAFTSGETVGSAFFA